MMINDEDIEQNHDYAETMGISSPAPGGGIRRYTVKRGHSFCGFCCDMRRAVIIVNLLNIIYVSIGVIVVATFSNIVENADDDVTYYSYQDVDRAFTTTVATGMIAILMSALVVMGAIRYNQWIIMVGIIYLFTSWITWTVVNLRAGKTNPDFVYREGHVVLSLTVTLLWIYPHAVFIKEIRNGIMRKDNYINEEQSCCCVW